MKGLLTKPGLQDEGLAQLVSARPSVQEVLSSIHRCDPILVIYHSLHLHKNKGLIALMSASPTRIFA